MANTHDVLAALVESTRCKPGWSFRFWEDDDGFKWLVITLATLDANRPNSGAPFRLTRFFPVPELSYNERTWTRWIFERCRELENHELAEWFRIGGTRPFEPLHGPGEDLCAIVEYRPDVDRLRQTDGSLREPFRED